MASNKLHTAFRLLQLLPDAGYLRNTYRTAVEVFKARRMFDSAFYYNDLYVKLNDSLENW